VGVNFLIKNPNISGTIYRPKGIATFKDPNTGQILSKTIAGDVPMKFQACTQPPDPTATTSSSE